MLFRSDLANKVIDEADINPGDTILEPSAGLGHMAEIIRERYPDNKLTVIEINYKLAEALKEKGPPIITYAALEKTISYLQSVAKKIEVNWLGPHAENSQKLDKKILVNKGLVLEENSINKNRL